MTRSRRPSAADATLRVRRATRRDWAALREIRLEALRESPEAFGSTFESAAAITARQWRDRVASRPYFLAERAGRVVGMVAGGFDERFPGTHWLYSLYVTSAERGTGVAAQLVAAVVAWARDDGATSLYLDVAAGAARARAFYAKAGFVPTGREYAMERDPSVSEYTLRLSIADELRVEAVAASRLYELRRRVLRNNDPAISVEEPRDTEPTSLHVAGLLGDRIVACASFYLDAAPVRPELVSYQLRFMAVDVDHQGHGYGARVLAYAEDVLRDAGAQQVWANARDTALGFYDATGWETIPGSAHVSAVTNLAHHRIAKLL